MRSQLVVVLYVVLKITECALPTDQKFWEHMAHDELKEALQVQWNLGLAKNVIMFIGDGMGPNTVTAARIYKGGESHRLTYEKFPHVGLLKTYSANRMVPDSACSATALLCGVKANQETVGVDASVHHKDCVSSLRPEARLKSLAALAIEAGKSAGLVTTMRVTHATPSPMYAHSADRRWECEASMPSSALQCKDIARQLVEEWPGKDLHVILGGGRQVLVSNSSSSAADPLDTWACIRNDGLDLIEKYEQDKRRRGLKHGVVFNTKQLQDLDVDNVDYLLGIFANGHLKYEYGRDRGPEGMPSISQMTEAAIKILQKNKKGYFLMVEGGNIDMAHHRGRAKVAIDEAAAMDSAVQAALDLISKEDTLLIVTSDHTHTLSINGYQERGSNIFGLAQESPTKNLTYTTLSYSTGGPGSFQFYVEQNGTQPPKVLRRNSSEDDTNSFQYEQIAAITLSENSHGGGDVGIYATGPYAHLFHNVHEQHYVYHVISYAAKMGAYSTAPPLLTPTILQGLLVPLLAIIWLHR